jgi:hypothetical protein
MRELARGKFCSQCRKRKECIIRELSSVLRKEEEDGSGGPPGHVCPVLQVMFRLVSAYFSLFSLT